MNTRNNDVYFAALQGREYLDALKEKVNVYRDFCGASGLKQKWDLSLGAYYGVAADGKNSWITTPGGEFGELVQMKVNDYASIVRHELVLAIQNRPAGMAKAVNMDSKTLRDARVGTQLVEYYLTDPGHQFENDYVQALELALLTAESFVVQDWDTAVGDVVRPDEEGNEIKAGDVVQSVFPVWNSACDLGNPSADKSEWRIFSKRVNKFALASKFKAHAEEIIQDAKSQNQIRKPIISGANTDQTDFVEIHCLNHPPAPQLPMGRYTLFINDEIILDTEYPYKKRNFFRCSDREMFGTAFGHTANYDLLGLEQVTDCLNSIAINALSTFGVMTIVGPKGGGLAHQELGKGQRYLELDPNLVDKIRVLDLAKIPDSLVEIISLMNMKKGELSGINSILKGDPQGQLKGASGAAMALLQSQAISFNSGIQRAFYRLLSDAGTGLIELMQQFADDPRIVQIAGKVNQQAVKEFKFDGQTMSSISTVVFEPINPILQTASGKLTVAETLMQNTENFDPNDYIEVLTTGNLNVVTNKATTMKEAILQENEQLVEGVPVKAVITENHKQHIDCHQLVISQPNAKQDPALVQRVLDHIQEHLDFWQEASMTNPQLLFATGQEVLPPPPMPQMPGMPPGAPGPGPSVGPAGNPNQAQAAGDAVKEPNLPNPPKNPATGEPAPVAPGTSVA